MVIRSYCARVITHDVEQAFLLSQNPKKAPETFTVEAFVSFPEYMAGANAHIIDQVLCKHIIKLSLEKNMKRVSRASPFSFE